MRTLSLPLEEYKQDLKHEFYKGRMEAFRRFKLILEESKKDKEEAVIMIVEDFEDDQKSIDQILIALDLIETAEKMWGRK